MVSPQAAGNLPIEIKIYSAWAVSLAYYFKQDLCTSQISEQYQAEIEETCFDAATDVLYCVECGVAQTRQDNLVDALYWYEKSMNYDPDFALPYFLAGSAHAKHGNYPQALEMLHAAVARGWDNADSIRYGEEFKPLHGMTEWERLIGRIM